MTRLLIESGAEILDTDICMASYKSCRTIIWEASPPDPDGGYQFPPPGLRPDEPKSKAFRAAVQMGHDELVDLVSKERRDENTKPFSLPSGLRLIEAVQILRS